MGINLEEYYTEDNIKLSDERIKELVSWYIKEEETHGRNSRIKN